MTQALKFKDYQNKLQALRARLVAHESFLRDEASQGAGDDAAEGIFNAPTDFADRASQQTEVAVSIGLATHDAVTRKEIEDALERISAGTFGSCEKCNAVISARRLNAIPYARYCVRCERRIEKENSL